jgi:hypothetical protein
MEIEQNLLAFTNASGTNTGYIDLPRALSAVNGKSIAQTKRHDGKYKPLGFLIRVRALAGVISIDSLNCGYPTRNSVVLAGAARDAMLKSAGVSRSNLESYQKELRLVMDSTMDGSGSNMFFPGATAIGTGSDGWGESLTYDYTKLVINQPDAADTAITKSLAMLGTQSADEDDWDADGKFFVVDNWLKFRHSFTPSATEDDIANNVFSWAMSQGETAGDIIDMIDDSQDDKPYSLADFTVNTHKTIVGTSVGNPTSSVFCAPLGLLKISTTGTAGWEIEVVGVTEL